MSQAAESAGASIAEVRVRLGDFAIAVATDRPTLLPSLLDRLTGAWKRVDSLRLDRSYMLWAEKAPFRLQIDRVVRFEGASLNDVLDAFAADVERLLAAR